MYMIHAEIVNAITGDLTQMTEQPISEAAIVSFIKEEGMHALIVTKQDHPKMRSTLVARFQRNTPLNALFNFIEELGAINNAT